MQSNGNDELEGKEENNGQSACGTGNPCLTGQIEFPRWEMGWGNGKGRERGGEVVKDDFIKGRGKSRGVQLRPPKKGQISAAAPATGLRRGGDAGANKSTGTGGAPALRWGRRYWVPVARSTPAATGACWRKCTLGKPPGIPTESNCMSKKAPVPLEDSMDIASLLHFPLDPRLVLSKVPAQVRMAESDSESIRQR